MTDPVIGAASSPAPSPVPADRSDSVTDDAIGGAFDLADSFEGDREAPQENSALGGDDAGEGEGAGASLASNRAGGAVHYYRRRPTMPKNLHLALRLREASAAGHLHMSDVARAAMASAAQGTRQGGGGGASGASVFEVAEGEVAAGTREEDGRTVRKGGKLAAGNGQRA